MKFSRSILALTAALAVPATFAIAQQAGSGMGGMGGMRGPSPEMMGRMQDGQLAGAKAMLRLTPEQERLWGPVEAQIRASFEERTKLRAEHQAERAARREAGERGKIGLPERLDKATEMTSKRVERLKAFSSAVKPLYAALSDEQKLVANRVLGHFVGGGKGGRGEHGWGGKGHRMHGEGGWGGKHAGGGWGHHRRGGHGGYGGPGYGQDMGGPGGPGDAPEQGPGMGGMGGGKQ